MTLETKTRGCFIKSHPHDSARTDLWNSVNNVIADSVIRFVSKAVNERIFSDVGITMCVPISEKLRQYAFKPATKNQSCTQNT
jgi:hypothetical protein